MKYTDFIREIEKDPEYHDACDALKPDFALGDVILRARIKHGWSQAELAKKAGVKPSDIVNLEAGMGCATEDVIQKLHLVFA